MRFIWWNVALATWLLISAFLFSQTPLSSAITFLAAVAVVGLAFAAGGKPPVRYVISVIMLALAIAALLLPDVSGAARINMGITAAILFALSMVSPTHSSPGPPATPAAQG
jgi:hypothetical protein